MGRNHLRIGDDASAGAWIAARLGGDFGAVTRAVPSGYPAYARICHPASDRVGEPASWADVAKATGRQVHPTMQWHALVGSSDPFNARGSLWPGGNPTRGNLPAEAMDRLCDLLADHTSTPEHCFFCIWEGYGAIPGDPPENGLGSDKPTRQVFSREELSRPRLHLPGRGYITLVGPLTAAPHIGFWHTNDWFIRQSPNLFWPADQAWCVASEIDFDSTLLGGTTELVDAIVRRPTLDSWPIQPDASLAADADQVNAVA